MQNNRIKFTIGKKVIYAAFGLTISLIVIFNIYSKQDASTKEDSNKVILYELKVSIDSDCDDFCLNELVEWLLKKDYVYEVNYDVDQLSIIYNGNKLTQSDLISFINLPISIISDQKVIMTCPEKCAYCNTETGLCKSFS